jgi:DNA-binding transcriptional ArsR family regulator
MKGSNIDQLFNALAHPIRREIIDLVAADPGITNGDICEKFDLSRIAISKHIKILAEADLIIIESEGRCRLHYFNVLPIQMIYDRWTDEYSRFFAQKINQFKLTLEKQHQTQGDSNEKTA